MVHRRGMRFCCCGVPLINIGAYFILIENALLGGAIAVLAFVPPQIVALMGAVPTWSKFIVGILGIAVLLWQLLGLIAISKEKPGIYRTYIRINFILTLATVAASATFITVGAVQHTKTVNSCVASFGATPQSESTAQLVAPSGTVGNVGRDICNVFIWIQVGLMGLLVALIGLTQFYMCYAQRSYGQQQRDAARDWKALKGEEIPLASWEHHA
ncbi:hypothetical protein K437DRAFT_255296 [Tilletiaria anomala UBC 951]|uniref:MARVEL domain-containing protein n=1 Tax=Tilletiaria anomala (strain ATCC 24038 / CBS 436.72 / UBC 951) TaxID=1037660 RepID=A0A066WAN0_TILAU|nr:uncharacterized protein K437DRAFT_255296 [Tilletiaria anomala UBC 951]KDN49613.1 hypothetical protein K437DRAFT_255296 [Tilletiaria anomala UBC 951]